jgi:hypothetical protein
MTIKAEMKDAIVALDGQVFMCSMVLGIAYLSAYMLIEK